MRELNRDGLFFEPSGLAAIIGTLAGVAELVDARDLKAQPAKFTRSPKPRKHQC